MFNIFNVIILIGAMQGYIVGLLLIKNHRFKQPQLYLGLLLIGFSAVLTKVTLVDLLGGNGFPKMYFNFIYLIAPSLYFYVRTLRKNSYSFKEGLFHLYPFVFINLFYFIFFLFSNSIQSYLEIMEILIVIDDITSFIYFTIYLFLSFLFLKRNKKEFKPKQVKWLRTLLFADSSFLSMWLVYIVSFSQDVEMNVYYPIMIILSLSLYYKSFYVINNKLIVFDTSSIFKKKNYVLEKSQSKILLNELNALMENQKPYLDGELSLSNLAKLLEVNPKTLSFVINEYIQKNFNDYINEWRIKEVKIRLTQKEYAHLKMLAIAFDCGFNSKSTFNFAFKKATGMSPSSYRKK